ncbi:MAG: phosphatase [Gemmatimonadetes bacterium]|nr:phosphatase [Gemmatimonadota bacterium]
MSYSRRAFLRTAGAVSVGFAGLHRLMASDQLFAFDRASGYGDLVPDPGELVDLPKGFTYKAISRTGELMDDGLYVPSSQDGMATFEGPDGRTILIRNHETGAKKMNDSGGPLGKKHEKLLDVPMDRFYDRGKGGAYIAGGTSTLIYNTKKQELERHYLSLIGTIRNCAGGPTPWNSWVTCEETTVRAGEETLVDHGYNFDVPANAQGLVKPVALKEMGRFNHEAIAVDPKSGCVYQTEDSGEGLIYRYIPNVPGKLEKGGKLQALAARDADSLDTRNWEEHRTVSVGRHLSVRWVDIENYESPNDDLRFQGWGEKGAARFARGEGMWYGNDAIYFACTNGGFGKHGQIFKYIPSPHEGTLEEEKEPGKLVLFVEPDDKALIDRADNLCVAPWGDLIVCEDGSAGDNIIGVTPEGEVYLFGSNSYSSSEFAGATFSPDGTTLFVNIQNPGITLAITGPWKKI